jgi:hypothetical protein
MVHNLQYGYENIENAAAYRATEQKQYIAYLSAPKKGTTVRNFVDGACYTVGEQGVSIIVSGTKGELYGISLHRALSEFCLPDGSSLHLYLKRTFSDKPLLFDWLKVKSIPVVTRFHTLFVPESQKFKFASPSGKVFEVNRLGFDHEGGDFILCSDVGGKPNFGDRWVVSGLLFRNLYTMRGRLAVLSMGKQTATPEPQKSLLSANVAAQAPIKVIPEPMITEIKCDTDNVKTQEPYVGIITKFHKISLAVAMALCDYNINHSSCPQVALNNNMRFTFRFADNMGHTAIILFDMEKWSFSICFTSSEEGKFFVKGEVAERNTSSAVRLLVDAIKLRWK